MTVAMPSAAAADDAGEEFHQRPVPLSGRLGFVSPALVWSGFGISYICMVIGGIIQQGLGTGNGILAILVGNVILFVYSSLIGYGGGKWGMNFPLTVKAVFGASGAAIPILVMAVLVTGWYAFQAWLTADILRVALGLDPGVAVGIAGAVIAVIMGLPVIFGIKWMANLMRVALPLMLLFAIYYLVNSVIPAGGKLFSIKGSGAIGFWTGVGMAWSTFVVSGTMTGDIVRYCRTGGEAVAVTGVAFLFSNAPFMILGALISAAISDPSVTYFLVPGTGLALLALTGIAILANWSTCDACLYNATMGYANAIPSLTWRSAAIVGTVIGVIAAGTGIISDVVNYLILLGLIVPPIGGAIIADYFVVRRKQGFSVRRDAAFNWAAIIAAITGLIIGIYAHLAFPNFLFGVPGIISSFVIYTVLAQVPVLGAGLSAGSSGAQTA